MLLGKRNSIGRTVYHLPVLSGKLYGDCQLFPFGIFGVQCQRSLKIPKGSDKSLFQGKAIQLIVSRTRFVKLHGTGVEEMGVGVALASRVIAASSALVSSGIICSASKVTIGAGKIG